MSTQLTEVDGRAIESGEEAHVRPGSTVQLAHVMTLRFLGSEQGASVRDAITLQHGADPAGNTVKLRQAVEGSADRA